MSYRIAICEDHTADCAYVEALVRSWAAAAALGVQIDSFPSAESFLFHYSQCKSYDILLLDIEMGGMDGVELAKKVRSQDAAVQIIFITGYSDYIAEGYEVSALHYLMKPVREDKLLQILDRAAQKLMKNEKALLLTLPDQTVRIPLYDIRYLEVRQNYVTIHADTAYVIKKPLHEFEQALDDRFYRMGRSYLINLSFVRRVTKSEVVLSDGVAIPLPRGQYQPLNKAFIAYI